MQKPEGRRSKMPEHMLMPQGGLPDAPLPHKDYTMHLLQYAHNTLHSRDR